MLLRRRSFYMVNGKKLCAVRLSALNIGTKSHYLHIPRNRRKQTPNHIEAHQFRFQLVTAGNVFSLKTIVDFGEVFYSPSPTAYWYSCCDCLSHCINNSRSPLESTRRLEFLYRCLICDMIDCIGRNEPGLFLNSIEYSTAAISVPNRTDFYGTQPGLLFGSFQWTWFDIYSSFQLDTSNKHSPRLTIQIRTHISAIDFLCN